jgi:four helix bundle protein
MKKEVKRFEDLQVWKDAMNLTFSIYEKFKLCKDYGFKDQIQRAAVSIPSNIAEGFERQTAKEFVQFLYIAKGSGGELRTQLYLSIKLNYLLKKEGMEMVKQAENISKMLYNLIAYRKNI